MHTSWGQTRTPAYFLLDAAGGPASGAGTLTFDRVIKSVRLSSGLYRTTYARRFEELDARVTPLLQEIFAREQALDLQDWGASDGVTSLEWAEVVLCYFPHACVTASDTIFYLLHATNGSRESYVLEPSGTPLQYVNPPFVLNLPVPDRPIYLLNRLLRLWAKRKSYALRELLSGIRWPALPDARAVSRSGWQFRPILMLHPRVVAYMAGHNALRVTYHDAFTPL